MPHIDYGHNHVRPPNSPQLRHGVDRVIQDSARYILDPDDDFARPYLAIPAPVNRAFIWPLGVEGFELVENAELGRHKYLGEIELDVDITHRAETMITLSGVFPGWTSVENMNALRDIFYRITPANGKILHLPGILPNLQYVVGESMRYTHAEDDRTMDIAYSITFVKVGTGKRAPDVGPTQPNEGRAGSTSNRGKRVFTVNSTYNTLRKIARKIYGNANRWTDLYSINTNAKWFNSREIPSHQIPDYRLPLGTKIYY